MPYQSFKAGWLPLLFIGFCCAFMSCAPAPEDGSQAQDNPGVPVHVMQIEAQPVQFTTNASGVLRSHSEVLLMSEIAGTVQGKVLEIGDPVSAGDAIIQLDAEPYELAHQQAAAGFASADAAYRQAARDFTRAQNLRENDDISDYELETAALAEQNAKANLEMAEAQLKLAERNLRLTRIASPVSGIVADLDVKIGQQISPGLPVGMVVSLNDLEVETGVSERQVVNILPGNAVKVYTDAVPGQLFDGKVKAVGVAGLDLGKAFPVIIAVKNPDRLLKPGMIVRMEITTFDRPSEIVIPRSALVLEMEKPTIFVVEEGLAYHRAIEIGADDSEHAVVTSGLTAGETLVIEGQNVLSDSVRVKVL